MLLMGVLPGRDPSRRRRAARGAPELALERAAVTRRDGRPQALARAAELGERVQHRRPVGEQDVAPHHGRALRDAGDVAESAARIRERPPLRLVRGDRVHEGRRDAPAADGSRARRDGRGGSP